MDSPATPSSAAALHRSRRRLAQASSPKSPPSLSNDLAAIFARINELSRQMKPSAVTAVSLSAQELQQVLQERDEELSLSAEIGQLILAKYEELEQQNATLRLQMDDVASQLSTMESNYREAFDLCCQLQRERQGLHDRNAELMKSLTEVELQLHDCRSDLFTKNELVVTLQSQLQHSRRLNPASSANVDLGELESQSIIEQTEPYRLLLDEKNEIAKQLGSRVQELENRLQLLPTQSQEAPVDVSHFLQAELRLQGKLEEYKQINQDLRAQLRQERDMSQKLNMDSETLGSVIREISSRNELLSKQLEEQQDLLAQSRQEILELNEQSLGNVFEAAVQERPASTIHHQIDSATPDSDPDLIVPRRSSTPALASSKRSSRVLESSSRSSFHDISDTDDDPALTHASKPFASLQYRLRKSLVENQTTDGTSLAISDAPKASHSKRNSWAGIVTGTRTGLSDFFGAAASAGLPRPGTAQRLEKRRSLTHLNIGEQTVRENIKSLLSGLQSPSDAHLGHADRMHTSIRQFLSRLQATNTTTLNRRLQKSFDMSDLTHLSNSILDNILLDINRLPLRFADWVHSSKDPLKNLLDGVVDLLREDVILRKTNNELSLQYVMKLTEWGEKDAKDHVGHTFNQPTPSKVIARSTLVNPSTGSKWKEMFKSSSSDRLFSPRSVISRMSTRTQPSYPLRDTSVNGAHARQSPLSMRNRAMKSQSMDFSVSLQAMDLDSELSSEGAGSQTGLRRSESSWPILSGSRWADTSFGSGDDGKLPRRIDSQSTVLGETNSAVSNHDRRVPLSPSAISVASTQSKGLEDGIGYLDKLGDGRERNRESCRVM